MISRTIAIPTTINNYKNNIFFKLTFFILFGIILMSNINAQVGQIIWEENFNELDHDIWNISIGDGCPELCGWGNAELEYYHSDNVFIEEIGGEPGNYALVLEAKSEAMGESSFTSGKVTTENNISIKYGMIEVRMKSPDIEVGLWPAVWLLGTNQKAVGWPQCGEIDMMEMGQSAQFRTDKGFPTASENEITGSNLLFFTEDACSGENQTCAASISSDNYYCTPYRAETPLNDRFVIYRLYWDDKNIQFTVEDNGVTHNMYTGPFPIGDESQEFNKPFFMILNLAIGGNFTDAANESQVNAPLPGKMYVDYIRIRKWNGKGEVTTPDQIMANAGGNITVSENDTVILDGSGSYGNIKSYEWSIADSIISEEMSHKLVMPAGFYEVKLTVYDMDGNSVSDDILVEVGNEAIGEIIWEENFDTFNSEIWNTITGDGCDQGPNMCGWGNFELEYYHPDNVSIEEISEETGNNALVIEAKKESVGSSLFTSGKVDTENKLAIKYGVIEVRMKVPDVQKGLWPAAWMLGINHKAVGWPECGEIDMMEMGHSDTEIARQGHEGVSQNKFVGANLLWYESGACADDNPTCAASIAFDTWYDKPYVSSTPLNDRFVIYRTYWDESEIRLTIEDNGIEYDLYEAPFPISENSAAFREPFYFVLNLAVGGSFTGIVTAEGLSAPIPAKLYVDYVRVRKWKGKGEVAFINGNSIANAGADQSLDDENKDGTETVILNASASYGNIVSYEWTEGGAQIALGENPSVKLSTGNHIITLTTTDINGKLSSDEVRIDIHEIIWEENFNNLNTNIWNIVSGDGCPDLCGWGNAELEYYKEDNVYSQEIEGEPGNYALVLEAKSESMGSRSFTSGKITTQNKMSIQYGLVEVRMQVPDLETGLWPAAWMLGINHDEVGWPHCGEIDIMEMGQSAQFREDKGISGATENEVTGSNLIFYSDAACSGDNPTCAASIAFDNYYCNPYNATTPLNDRFVIYRTYWDDMEIRFTVEDNGNEYDLYTGPFPISSEAGEFHKPFYFLLNLAVGGNFTDASAVSQVTAPLPAKMLVDYVKIKKWNGKGGVAFENGLVANAGTDILVIDKDGDKSETIILDGSESSDHNGSIVSYSWSKDGEEITTGITSSISLSRATHIIVLTVTDNDGNIESDSVTVVVSGGGLAPTANAGNDTILYDNNGDDLVTFTLNGINSYDLNDTIIGYKWLENEIEIANGIKPTIELSTGQHTITLVVTNSDSLTNSDEINITVIDPDNIAPVANAGPDQLIVDDNDDDLITVLFDGSGSSDSDGSIESYSWYVAEVEIASGESPSIEMSTGVYPVILRITDNDGVADMDTMMLTIVDPDNVAPIAFAGADSIIIDEDLDGIATFTLDASESFDSDGTIESYLWLENQTEISSEITFSKELSLGLHIIVLQLIDDDGISSSDTVQVKVNQLPVAIAGKDTLSTDTDGNGYELINLDGSESYDPYGSIESYSWVLNGNEINTGEKAKHTFDVGTNEVSLIVTDNDGFTDTDNILVIIARVNNIAPIAHAGEDISIQEDDDDGLLLVQLDGSGSIDSDGEIYSYVWKNNDQEIARGMNPSVLLQIGNHKITLEVTDNEGATSTDEVIVTIIDRVNIALYKKVVTSSTENGETPGSNAVDGDETTRWASAFSDPQWIYVDFGAIYNLNEVVLKWEDAYANSYEIQISDDASNWTTLYTETSGDGGTDKLSVVGSGRYLRVYGTTRATEYGYSLFELEVYGTIYSVPTAASLSDLMINNVTVDGFNSNIIEYFVELVAGTVEVPIVTAVASDGNASISITDAETLPGKTTVKVSSADETVSVIYTVYFTLLSESDNLALNKNTMTSSDENELTTGSKAVDGDELTRWSSEWSDPQWIYVDLGAEYTLSKVILLWEAAYALNYEIQISDDANNWTTIYSETSGNGGLDEILLTETGRYVRVYSTTRATQYGYSLFEFEVYGTTPVSNIVELYTGEANTIFIYPNPVNKYTTIKLTKKSGTIYIRDISGSTIEEIPVIDFIQTINMQNYSRGIYFITVIEDYEVITAKIIKK